MVAGGILPVFAVMLKHCLCASAE